MSCFFPSCLLGGYEEAEDGWLRGGDWRKGKGLVKVERIGESGGEWDFLEMGCANIAIGVSICAGDAL